MNRTTPLSFAAAALFAASAAFAQTGAGTTGAGGPGAAGGQAQGTQQMTPGTMRTNRFDPTNAPGWGSMSQAERDEMMKRMDTIKSYDECRSYMTQHGERMRSRGAQMGTSAGDPCAHMQRG